MKLKDHGKDCLSEVGMCKSLQQDRMLRQLASIIARPLTRVLED